MKYIILLGAFQSAVALGLFLQARHKKPADSILNWMLLCLVTHLSIKFVIYGLLRNVTLQTAFNTFTDLAYGPLFWMYARKIKDDKFNVAKNAFHFIPAIIACVAYVITSVAIFSGTERYPAIIAGYNLISQYFILVSIPVYSLMAFVTARQLPAFWQAEKQLIRRISVCFFCISGISLLVIGLEKTGLITVGYLTIYIRFFAYLSFLVISLLIVVYRVKAQNELSKAIEEAVTDVPATLSALQDQLPISLVAVPQAQAANEILPQTAITGKKYLLTTMQMEELAQRLIVLVTTKKLFTDPDLSLEKLSALARMPRNHISETLNQHIGKSFYQFINEFRIAEVVRLLDKFKAQQIPVSILSIAFEAGFNSKTTFNQYFKKTTGFTPSEYLKKDKNPAISRAFVLPFSSPAAAPQLAG